MALPQFNFTPLFNATPRFAYGFGVYFDNVISHTLIGRPFNYSGDANDACMWLEYPSDELHIDTSANMTTSFATLLTNASGSISGASNDCEGLLGATCVKNLKDVLTWAVVLSTVGIRQTPFDVNVGKFQSTPLRNLSCPDGIFDDYQSLLLEGKPAFSGLGYCSAHLVQMLRMNTPPTRFHSCQLARQSPRETRLIPGLVISSIALQKSKWRMLLWG